MKTLQINNKADGEECMKENKGRTEMQGKDIMTLINIASIAIKDS